MVNDIASILASKNYDEPPEVTIIKQYVQRHFQAAVAVTIHQSQIIIGVQNSALAGALRTHLRDIAEECKTSKRLLIRIG